ncbi:MAG: V-type ATPase subunit subunit G family protein [Nitrososphaeria archaeon]|jgi:vacuolar-type H+-ATPase subunit H
MPIIKDLVDEEKKTEETIKEAEDRAKEIVNTAKKKANQLIREAENEVNVVKDLTDRRESEIAIKKEAVVKAYSEKVEEIETSCERNFGEAVDFILNYILGEIA